ncbi:MAG: ribonuclease R [Ignavibacteriales bacterium]|jgi:ribonuclease R|nr:MAG: ribonuclease R [Ignavibacteriales bacterium]
MKKEIKAFFTRHPSVKIKPRELSKKLNAREPHLYEKLKETLFRLYKEGLLEKEGKRYFLHLSQAQKKNNGVIQIIDDGKYAFVVLNDSPIKDVFVSERNLGNALNGDVVEIEIFDKQRGKNKEGKVLRVIERKNKEIVGKLVKSNSTYFVIPDQPELHRDIYIHKQDLHGAKNGDKVLVADIVWDDNSANPQGVIKDNFGKAGSYEAEIMNIAREFNLNYKFPPKVINQANKTEIDITEEEIKSRMDIRDKIVFTIDPDDAKDFDDALSVEELSNGNLLIGIHIADVAHYVTEGSPIFKEAQKRANSVYLVGTVIPMLPEKLSNQICSLVPNEDRLTFSVVIEMTKRTKIIDYKISKTIINSRRRFTYNEVQEILDHNSGDFFEEISLLNKIAKQLRSKRMNQGSINFHTPEVNFKLDENGVPTDIIIKEVKDSHKLVEEFMLLANQVIATHVNKQKKNSIPFVYRVHDLPDEEKLKEFASFVKSLGYTFEPSAANKSKEFQRLLEEVEGTSDNALINEVAIRSMAKAVYSTDNIGHYGLGFKYYTHFTSPIRRFPDLIVHKILFDNLHGRDSGYNSAKLESICDHCSAQERSAINAERLSVKLKQMEYLKNRIGEEFTAIISGITNFGIFVELRENLSEGLIRLRDIKDDYYIFDQKQYAIIGQDTGKKYRLGDKINVKLIRVDESKRETDFALLN